MADIGLMGRMRNQAAHNALQKQGLRDLSAIQPGSPEFRALSPEDQKRFWVERPNSGEVSTPTLPPAPRAEKDMRPTQPTPEEREAQARREAHKLEEHQTDRDMGPPVESSPPPRR